MVGPRFVTWRCRASLVHFLCGFDENTTDFPLSDWLIGILIGRVIGCFLGDQFETQTFSPLSSEAVATKQQNGGRPCNFARNQNKTNCF